MEAIASIAPGLCLGALSKIPIKIYRFLIEVPFAKKKSPCPSSMKYQACLNNQLKFPLPLPFKKGLWLLQFFTSVFIVIRLGKLCSFLYSRSDFHYNNWKWPIIRMSSNLFIEQSNDLHFTISLSQDIHDNKRCSSSLSI